MDTSAIAALSMAMSQNSLMQSVNMAATKKAMDGQEAMAAQLIQDLQAANPAPAPSFGHILDVTV